MQTEYIKEFNGRIIGILETLDNGDQQVRDFNTRFILGYYRAKYNHTTDFYGRVVSSGNTVVQFLYMPRK